MRKYLILLILFIGAYLKGFNQIRDKHDLRYQKLLDAVNVSGNFIYSKPVNEIVFFNDLFNLLYSVGAPNAPEKIDTSVIMDIMRNNKVIDTTEWTDKEIRKYPLVKATSKVSLKYVLKKLHLCKKEDVRFYKAQVDSINSPEACNVKVYNISKPLFDSKKEYALFEYDLYGCEETFIKTVIIFKYEKNNWKELGVYDGLIRGLPLREPRSTILH